MDVRPEPPRPSGGPVQRPRKLRTRASAYAPHVLHHVTVPVTSSACERTGSAAGGMTATLRPSRENRTGNVVWPSAVIAVLQRSTPTGPRAASSSALQLTARFSLRLLKLTQCNWPEAAAMASCALLAPICACTSHASSGAVSVSPRMAAINARTATFSLERDLAWPLRRLTCEPCRPRQPAPPLCLPADSPGRSNC